MHFLVLLSALVACAAGVPSNTTNPKPDERIVGGSEVEIENHPYQVALLYFGILRCGGAIVSPTCVVTAASCIVGLNVNYLTVRAGSPYYDWGGTIYPVTSAIHHERYNEDNYNDYDVAVLKVDTPFQFSDRIQSIALQDYEIYYGSNVAVTGWGTTRMGGPFNYYLEEAVVQIRDRYECYNWYNGYISYNMICAGHRSGYVGPCNGDTGGPLTTINCPRKLVGIVSFGEWNCGNPSYPTIYTKISAVRDWIIDKCNA